MNSFWTHRVSPDHDQSLSIQLDIRDREREREMHDNISTDNLSADNGKFILLCIISVLVIIADKLRPDNTKTNCLVEFIQQAFDNCREFSQRIKKIMKNKGKLK